MKCENCDEHMFEYGHIKDNHGVVEKKFKCDSCGRKLLWSYGFIEEIEEGDKNESRNLRSY